MTGYVSRNEPFKIDDKTTVTLEISLKSLNSKYLEVNNKLAYIFYSVENEIIRLLKKELKRGSVYLMISVSGKFKTTVDVSLETLDGYMEAIEQIKQKYALTDTVKIADIIRLPNVFVAHEQNLTEDQKERFLVIIKGLVDDLIKERLKEGADLEKDIRLRIKLLTQEIQRIEQEFEKHFAEKQKVIHAKLNDVVINDPEYAENQRKMLYTMLDKMDINEELVRFKSHLHKLDELLASPEIEKGKALDFTLQELSREINTILSKTSSAAISSIGLGIKVDIEKAREQAQNLV